MKFSLPASRGNGLLLLASSLFIFGVALSERGAGADQGAGNPRKSADSASVRAQPLAAPKASPYHPATTHVRAREYYQSVWGIDNMLVRQTASSNLIRFSFRVIDPERAKVLGDKRSTPYLIGQRSHAMLQVPVMEKVGQLRQTGKPEAGKEYWMVFSNKGNLVKPGDLVNVVIGPFHVEGLVVE